MSTVLVGFVSSVLSHQSIKPDKVSISPSFCWDHTSSFLPPCRTYLTLSRMTLPNRPGYVVEGKNVQRPPPPNTQITINSPPQHHPTPNTPGPTFHPTELASLFPFHGTPESVSRIIDSKTTFPIDSHRDSLPLPVQGQPINPFNPEPFKPQLSTLESLSVEELSARKNFIRSHRNLPVIIDFLTTCKKEGISPSAETFHYLQENNPPPGPIDHSLEEFLAREEIETGQLEDPEEDKSAERIEFLQKMGQLKEKYNEELDKLSRVCSEFSARMFGLLREQSTLRPISAQETQMKIQGTSLLILVFYNLCIRMSLITFSYPDQIRLCQEPIEAECLQCDHGLGEAVQSPKKEAKSFTQEGSRCLV